MEKLQPVRDGLIHFILCSPVTGELHPKHVVQATGHSGEKSFPSHIPGISDFQGDRLCHSSEFTGAKEDSKGKHAIVVGCCNSAHDIAQDFYEKGYSVTMVQRSSTFVVSSKSLLDVLIGGLYKEDGVRTGPLKEKIECSTDKTCSCPSTMPI